MYINDEYFYAKYRAEKNWRELKKIQSKAFALLAGCFFASVISVDLLVDLIWNSIVGIVRIVEIFDARYEYFDIILVNRVQTDLFLFLKTVGVSEIRSNSPLHYYEILVTIFFCTTFNYQKMISVKYKSITYILV